MGAVTGYQQRVGRAAEELAERHLVDHGCRVVTRRYRRRGGELDLVVRDGPTTVFVEVKARRSDAFGSPGEAVTALKRRRIRRTAARWIVEKGGAGPCRFDVVLVVLSTGQARVRWIRDAF